MLFHTLFSILLPVVAKICAVQQRTVEKWTSENGRKSAQNIFVYIASDIVTMPLLGSFLWLSGKNIRRVSEQDKK